MISILQENYENVTRGDVVAIAQKELQECLPHWKRSWVNCVSSELDYNEVKRRAIAGMVYVLYISPDTVLSYFVYVFPFVTHENIYQ